MKHVQLHFQERARIGTPQGVGHHPGGIIPNRKAEDLSPGNCRSSGAGCRAGNCGVLAYRRRSRR